MTSDNWTLVNEWTVIDNADVEFTLEEFRDGPQQIMMVHLALKGACCTPKLLKWMLNTWRVFIKHVTCPLFTCSTTDDETWRHFISLFGFKPLTEIIWSDGTRRWLYWHGNDEIINKHQLGQRWRQPVRDGNEPGKLPSTVSVASVLGSDELTGASVS